MGPWGSVQALIIMVIYRRDAEIEEPCLQIICDRNKLDKKGCKAPKYCIDYVGLHELLHFKYRYHDRNFYDLMTVLMTDWKERKKILDEDVVRNL